MTNEQVRCAMYERWTSAIQRQEDELGSRLSDGPSSDELRGIFTRIEEVVFRGPDTTSPSNIWELYKQIGDVADLWFFPENDPVAPEVLDYLNSLTENLGKSLDECMPESAEQRETYASLRIVSRVAKRAVLLQSQKDGSKPRKFEPKVLFQTSLATFLYRVGKLLSNAGGKSTR